MSSFLDSTGLQHFWEKIKAYVVPSNIGAADREHTHIPTEIVPLQTKTYTGVYCPNTDPAGWLYYGKALPDDYYKPWHVKFIARMKIANREDGYAVYEFNYYGMRNTYSAYSCLNRINNSSYRPIYAEAVFPANINGVTNGYGFCFGYRLQSSSDMNNATYARTIEIELYEAENCTFTFFDSMVAESGVEGSPVAGSATTYYEKRQSFDGTTNGITITADRNDVNYYNRNYYGCRVAYAPIYRYQFCLSRKDRSVFSISTTNNKTTLDKEYSTTPFDPFGDILYWPSSSTYNAGANVGDGWYSQYLADLRYSFNCGGNTVASTLVARKPLYLVAEPQDDGTAVLHSEPISQELPQEEDGLIYIYLGQIYPDTNPYRLYMSLAHPVYIYKDGNIYDYRQYCEHAKDSDTVNGHTVGCDVPSDAEFTDTTYGAGTGLALNGTTFSNTGVTGIKGNSETSYRTGQVNLTPSNIGAIAKNSELQTTNPFAPPSLQGVYISKIDNAFYAADKRWVITGVTQAEAKVLFDGSYEAWMGIPAGTSKTITFDFENSTSDVGVHNGVKVFPNYPYGYILVSFYYNAVPLSVTGRVYCNYEQHGIGWSDITFTQVSGSDSTHCVYRGRQGKYAISKLEITVTANSSTTAELSEIEMHLDRPSPFRNPFLSKYNPETLYYDLTAPNFNGKINNHTVNSDVPSNAVFTDTKNTTGATDNSSKLFLIGATAQTDNPQTYSQNSAYIDEDGNLYSNGKQAVNLSDNQALTNKTYNGYTLGDACAKQVDTSVAIGSTSLAVPTSKAVSDLVSSVITISNDGIVTFY